MERIPPNRETLLLVRSQVAKRLAHLDLTERRLLVLISVLNGFASPRTLAAAQTCSGEPPARDSARRLSRLEVLGLISLLPDGSAQITSDRLREALLTAVPSTELARLHGAAGNSLALTHRHARDAVAEAVAEHYLRAADAGFVERALEWLGRAARVASEGFAWERATELLETALGLVDRHAGELGNTAGWHCDLLLQLADYHERWRDPPGAGSLREEALEFARRAGDAQRVGRAALALTPLGCAVVGSVAVRAEILDQAELALPRDESALRARLLARRALYRSLDPWPKLLPHSPRGEMQRDELIRLAERSGDPLAIDECLLAHLVTTASSLPVARRQTLTARLVAQTAASPDVGLRAVALHLHALTALQAGDREAFNRAVVTCRKIARAGAPHIRWLVPCLAGAGALLDGRATEALGLADESWNCGRDALRPLGRLVRGEVQCAVHRLRGTLPGYVAAKREIWADWTTIPAIRALWARLEAETGNLAAAARLVRGFTPGDLDAFDHQICGGSSLARLARAVCLLGDRVMAERLYPRLGPFADECVVGGYGAVCEGPISLVLALLADLLERPGEAKAFFARARESARHLQSSVLLIEVTEAEAAMRSRRAGPQSREKARALIIEADRLRDALPSDLAATPPPGLRETIAELPPTWTLRRTGSRWLVSDQHGEFLLPPFKALYDLHLLVTQPGRPIPVTLLAGTAPAAGSTAISVKDITTRGQADAAAALGLDRIAYEQYRRRLIACREERVQAESAHDLRAVKGLDREVAQIDAEIAANRRLAGGAGNSADRARKAVSLRLRRGIDQIAAHCPELAHHLRRSVHTGFTCVYEPCETAHWLL